MRSRIPELDRLNAFDPRLPSTRLQHSHWIPDPRGEYLLPRYRTPITPLRLTVPFQQFSLGSPL
jgi:hypothetical protein